MKRVRYNGGTLSYNGSSNPANLVVGREYIVLTERVGAWQTDYTLKGVPGEYNSVWFDDLGEIPTTYLAVATKVPVVGERCECQKLEFQNGTFHMRGWRTSTVRAVEEINIGAYKVTTQNSVYIVSVNY